MSLNQNQKTHFIKNGKRVEQAFAKLFLLSEFPTQDEDWNEHWDVEIPEFGKVDVKGLKKVQRLNDNPDENFHWIEIKSVIVGNGWAYGDADCFAFELLDYFLVVSKGNLHKLISEKVKKKYVEKPEPYKLYQRCGRKDVITLVKTVDLFYICEALLKKN